jgi:c-di-AMP phosphodiesterase-like protein
MNTMFATCSFDSSSSVSSRFCELSQENFYGKGTESKRKTDSTQTRAGDVKHSLTDVVKNSDRPAIS